MWSLDGGSPQWCVGGPEGFPAIWILFESQGAAPVKVSFLEVVKTKKKPGNLHHHLLLPASRAAFQNKPSRFQTL